MKKIELTEAYIEKHPGSAAWHDRALNYFPADGTTHFIRILEPFRPYINRAEGCKKYDVDGNCYTDYIMGHGALLLGHNHPHVVKAVQEQAGLGVLYGENHELEVRWAELIREMMPVAERVLFFPCGNEANMMALRLGRVFTGRKKIIRFEKNYHGWADELASPAEPAVCQDNIVFLPQNDLKSLEEVLAGNDIAAVFTEAGGAFLGGRTPIDPDFVMQVPGLARKHGALWILDEVVTGFRFAPGGWQERMNLKPDLTTLGKCLGGGLSVGALVGRADIFEAFNLKNRAIRPIMHGGTWNANPLSAAAGIAACSLFKNGVHQEKAAAAAAIFREEGNRLLRDIGISGSFYGPSSIIYLYLGPVDNQSFDETMPLTGDYSRLTDPGMNRVFARLLLHLLQRGVSNIMGSIFVFSSAHEKEDIEYTLNAFGEALQALSSEGVLPDH